MRSAGVAAVKAGDKLTLTRGEFRPSAYKDQLGIPRGAWVELERVDIIVDAASVHKTVSQASGRDSACNVYTSYSDSWGDGICSEVLWFGRGMHWYRYHPKRTKFGFEPILSLEKQREFESKTTTVGQN